MLHRAASRGTCWLPSTKTTCDCRHMVQCRGQGLQRPVIPEHDMAPSCEVHQMVEAVFMSCMDGDHIYALVLALTGAKFIALSQGATYIQKHPLHMPIHIRMCMTRPFAYTPIYSTHVHTNIYCTCSSAYLL